MSNTNIYTIYDEDFSYQLSPEQINEWTEEELESLTTSTEGELHPVYGYKHTEEHKKSITGKGNPMFGKVGANKGRVWGCEISSRISKTMKGKSPSVNNTKAKCKYCEYETTLGPLARYHNENCKYK